MRRPGLRIAPAINTSTCCQVGVVKAWLNGSIQAASLSCRMPARIRPPNPIGERLDRIESAANPWCDHKGFNGHAPSKNGQSRAKTLYAARCGVIRDGSPLPEVILGRVASFERRAR